MKLVYGQGYNIHAYWEGRAESPDALATRFLRQIDRLRGIDPIFALWTCCTTRPTRFETMRDRYTEVVVAGLAKDDWGESEPIYG